MLHECRICRKVFPSRTYLTIHLFREHGIGYLDNDSKEITEIKVEETEEFNPTRR